MVEIARPRSRRDEYAQQTRRDVVSAARRLFAAQGYAATTVDTIAAEAGVSPATVYAQCGGKEGLLSSLMDLWTAGSLVQEIIEKCAAVEDARAKLDVLAQGYIDIYRESGDIINIVIAAASSTASAREFLETANSRHLDALSLILAPLESQGALRAGLELIDAARIVYFHFHHGQFVLASDGFGWGVDTATAWLTDRVAAAIL